jgi:hypothetical protein
MAPATAGAKAEIEAEKGLGRRRGDQQQRPQKCIQRFH